jgi:hypothetical protein
MTTIRDSFKDRSRLLPASSIIGPLIVTAFTRLGVRRQVGMD